MINAGPSGRHSVNVGAKGASPSTPLPKAAVVLGHELGRALLEVARQRGRELFHLLRRLAMRLLGSEDEPLHRHNWILLGAESSLVDAPQRVLRVGLVALGRPLQHL